MKLVKFCLSLFAIISINAMAAGLDLDSAKQQGLVGEKQDGYVGIVIASPEVVRLVSEINEKRKLKYLELAKNNGITLEQVQKLAAKKAFSKTQPGHFLLVNGNWQKKPD